MFHCGEVLCINNSMVPSGYALLIIPAITQASEHQRGHPEIRIEQESNFELLHELVEVFIERLTSMMYSENFQLLGGFNYQNCLLDSVNRMRQNELQTMHDFLWENKDRL